MSPWMPEDIQPVYRKWQAKSISVQSTVMPCSKTHQYIQMMGILCKKNLSLRGIFSETMLASFPWAHCSMAQNDWFLTNKVLPERKALMKWIFRPSMTCLWLHMNFPHVCWLPLEFIDKCVYFAKTRGENTHFLHKLFRLLATNSRMLCHTIVVRVP